MEHHHSVLYEPANALWHALGLPGHLPDHVVMAIFVLIFSTIFFAFLGRNLRKRNPGNLQQMMELLVDGLRGMIEDVIGHGAAKRFLYIIGAFTVFIFLSNIVGLVYFLQPPTGNVNTTVALAAISFLYYNYHGFKENGLGYFKHFWGPVALIGPLMFVIEVVGHFARILSLGMRLFGNITGEHTATGIFQGMLPVVLPWPMMALGVFGSTLQTFIFIMLTMVYIGGAVSHEEH